MKQKIHPTAVVDEPYRMLQGFKSFDEIVYRKTNFGNNIAIGAGAVIGKGVTLEDNVVIDHHCIIEPNVTIGTNSLLIYRAIVSSGASIGANCVIGGFISEDCIVGSNCRIFGQLIHKQTNTQQSWDDLEAPEGSVRIKENVFVGFGALLIGNITIGSRTYVCAGAIVTRDIPDGHIAYEINKIIPANKWSGVLALNPVFGRSEI